MRQYASVSIIAAVAFVATVATIIAIVLAVLGEQVNGVRRPRAPLLVWLGVILLATGVGVVWMRSSLAHYAGSAGAVSGLIAHPSRNGSTYEFTRDGRLYLLWAFEVPVISTSILLLSLSLAGTRSLLSRGYRRSLLALWSAFVLCIIMLLTYAIKWLAVATNLFI